MHWKQVAMGLVVVIGTTACPLEWGKEGFVQRAAHKDNQDNQDRVWEDEVKGDRPEEGEEKAKGDKQDKPCGSADACIEKKYCPQGQENCR